MSTSSHNSTLKSASRLCRQLLRFSFRTPEQFTFYSGRYTSFLRVFITDFSLYHLPKVLTLGDSAVLLLCLKVILKSALKLFLVLPKVFSGNLYFLCPDNTSLIFLRGFDDYLFKGIFEPLLSSSDCSTKKQFSYFIPSILPDSHVLPNSALKIPTSRIFKYWCNSVLLSIEIFFASIIVSLLFSFRFRDSRFFFIRLFYCHCQLLASLFTPRVFWGFLVCDLCSSSIRNTCNVFHGDCADPIPRYFEIITNSQLVTHYQIQSGFITHNCYEWMFSISSKVFVWTDHSLARVKNLFAKNPFIKHPAISVLGNPRLFPSVDPSFCFRESDLLLSPNTFNILFLTTYSMASVDGIASHNQSTLSLAIDAITFNSLSHLSLISGSVVHLKPHPCDNTNYKSLLSRSNVRIIDNSILSSESIMPLFDLVVGFSSTSIIKSFAMGIPYILLGGSGLEIDEVFLSLVDSISVFYCDSPDRLARLVDSIRGSKCVSPLRHSPSVPSPLNSELGSYNPNFLLQLLALSEVASESSGAVCDVRIPSF